MELGTQQLIFSLAFFKLGTTFVLSLRHFLRIRQELSEMDVLPSERNSPARAPAPTPAYQGQLQPEYG